jgi:anaerobic ribonucleoside-triphosphate reductase
MDKETQVSYEGLKDAAYSDSSTNAAQRRVKSALQYSLKNKYGIDDDEVTRGILKVHGLDESSFDVIARAEKCLSEGLSDTSFDQNSNKSGKSIPGLLNETATIPFAKILGYRELYRKMKELYGKNEAKRLSGEMYDYSLALNDSSNILKIYCYSYDFSKLVLEGRTWGQLKSLPPKRVSSYVAALSETVHNLASETAGACAISSFFLDVAHIIIFNEKKSLFTVKHNKAYRKYLENNFQSLVHSVNHLSRNSVESPFTNVSIMDTPKIEGLVADDNMGWYFNGSKWSKKDIVSLIKELQEIWIDFFDKGDPSADGRPYRFPVMTLNITKGADGKVIDKDFVKKMSKREIFRYNIMVSKAGKFANCCFGPNTNIYAGRIDEVDKLSKVSMKSFVEKYIPEKEYKGEKIVKDIFDECIYAFNSFEKNGEKITEAKQIKAVSILPNNWGKLYNVTFNNIGTISMTPDQKVWLGDIDNNGNKKLIEASKIDAGKYSSIISSIEIVDSTEPVYDIEIASKEHIFTVYSDSDSEGVEVHNCRLVSDSEMFDLGGEVSSLGMSQISLGSHRVVAINFNRIALEANGDKDKFYSILEQRCESAAKILAAHKALLGDLEKKGYEPFITRGYIRFDRLFSTFGIAGIVEAVQNMKMNKVEGLKEILHFVNTKAKENSVKYKINVNIEQIPAESMAVRLHDVDKMIFKKEPSKTPLYANQMCSLWEDYSLTEKMKVDGALSQCYTGGSITHFNLADRPTPTQIDHIINTAIETGDEYFALNAIYSECNDGHNSFGKLKVCPRCGKPIVQYYTRVVGFFVPILNVNGSEGVNKVRREFDFPNRKFVDLNS